MNLIATQDFSWAHRGVDIKHYEAGQPVGADDADLVRVGQQEGWLADADKVDVKPVPTKAQIQAELAELGIDYPANATKAELLALLD